MAPNPNLACVACRRSRRLYIGWSAVGRVGGCVGAQQRGLVWRLMARQAAAVAAAAGVASEGRAQQHFGSLCPSTKASLPHHTEIGAVCLWLVVLQLIVFIAENAPFLD